MGDDEKTRRVTLRPNDPALARRLFADAAPRGLTLFSRKSGQSLFLFAEQMLCGQEFKLNRLPKISENVFWRFVKLLSGRIDRVVLFQILLERRTNFCGSFNSAQAVFQVMVYYRSWFPVSVASRPRWFFHNTVLDQLHVGAEGSLLINWSVYCPPNELCLGWRPQLSKPWYSFIFFSSLSKYNPHVRQFPLTLTCCLAFQGWIRGGWGEYFTIRKTTFPI